MGAPDPRLGRQLDTLVAEHGSAVFRVCRSILRDEHLSADAAQEAFLRLWRRTLSGAHPRHAAGWLRRVAVTTSLDLLRRRRVRDDALAELGTPAETTARPPEALLQSAELTQRYEDALDELAPGQRTVFLLRHEAGLSLSEVADALDLALPTVKTQFARAALRLAERMRPFDPSRNR